MFPRVPPDTSPRSYPDGHLGKGFMLACLPFTLGTTTTMAINAFNLLADWLAYRSFNNLDLPSRVHAIQHNDGMQDAIWGWDEIYRGLPDVYFSFLIVATVVFFMEIVRFSFMLSSQRKKFKDKRDGLPIKKKAWQKFGSEGMILLHVFSEDLPISLVLLAVQVAISCNFFVPFRDKIFLLCMGSTCLSVCWKILQIVWNAGCLGQREEFQGGCALGITRGFILVLLGVTLGISTLNLLLFPAMNTNFNGHSLTTKVLDKVGIHHWTHEDHIAFIQSEILQTHETSTEYYNANFTDTFGVRNTGQLDSNSPYYTYVNLTAIDEVLYNEENHTTITVPCDINNVILDYMQPVHKKLNASSQDCSIHFHFSHNAFQKTVFYNYAYRFLDGNRCLVGVFTTSVALKDAEWTLKWQDSMKPTVETPPVLLDSLTEDKILHHQISMSPLTADNWVKCSYDLVYNESIPLWLC